MENNSASNARPEAPAAAANATDRMQERFDTLRTAYETGRDVKFRYKVKDGSWRTRTGPVAVITPHIVKVEERAYDGAPRTCILRRIVGDVKLV